MKPNYLKKTFEMSVDFFVFLFYISVRANVFSEYKRHLLQVNYFVNRSSFVHNLCPFCVTKDSQFEILKTIACYKYSW